MRTTEELISLIEKNLSEKMDQLYADLSPEERAEVFPNLVSEWIEVNY